MPKGHFVRTEAHKAAIAAAHTGRPKSEESRRKMSEARRGVPWNDPDGSRRAALVARMEASHPTRGKTLSEEWKQKLSDAKQGKVHPLLVARGITQEQYTEQLQAGNKWCSHGKHFTHQSTFSPKKGVCTACMSDHNRQCDLKKKFAVTPEWYDQKLAEQGGICAICGHDQPSSNNKNFHIDHNHKTGEARGVLCSGCNTALARIEAIPDWCVKALSYLSKYNRP